MTTLIEAVNPVTLYDAVVQNDDAMVNGDGALVQLAKKGQTGRVEGDQALYDVWTMNKGLAPLNTRGANPTQAPNHTEDVKRVGMYSISEEFAWPWHQLAINRRQPTSASQAAASLFNPDGASRLRTKLAEMTGRVRRSAEQLVAQSLLNPSGFALSGVGLGSRVSENIAYGQPTYSIPAGEKWGSAATKVLSSPNHLAGIRNAMNANGRDPHMVIGDLEIFTGLLGNTEIQQYAGHQAAAAGLKSGIDYLRDYIKPYTQEGAKEGKDPFSDMSPVFAGLGGIPLWLQWNHGYESSPGTFVRFLDTAKGRAIVLPKDLKDVWGFAEGPVALPEEAMGRIIGAGQFEQVFKRNFGITSYCYLAPRAPWDIILHVEYAFNFFIMAPKKILVVLDILSD